jgi:hypothetical protein
VQDSIIQLVHLLIDFAFVEMSITVAVIGIQQLSEVLQSTLVVLQLEV